MPHRRLASMSGYFWLAIILSLSCSGKVEETASQESPKNTDSPVKHEDAPSREIDLDLKRISLAYFHCCSAKLRAPKNVDELARFLVATDFPESQRQQEEECLQKIKAGQYVVMWNQEGAPDAKEGTGILVAFEARTAEKGGFVVFADGRVQWMNSTELKEATRK